MDPNNTIKGQAEYIYYNPDEFDDPFPLPPPHVLGILPPLIHSRIKEFNQLAKGNYSLNLKAFALRNVIEAIALIHKNSFQTPNLLDFIKKKKFDSTCWYNFIIGMLNNEIHINAFSLFSNTMFNTLCGISNLLLLDMIKEKENNPILHTLELAVVKEGIDDFTQKVKELKKFNNQQVKKLEGLKFNIQGNNKYKLQAIIIWLINRIYAKEPLKRWVRNKNDENSFNEALKDYISTKNIKETDLQIAWDFIEGYTKEKTKIGKKYYLSQQKIRKGYQDKGFIK